ncbi:hypothetical protein FH972_022350 [Carpinus fangiana]|uniref:Aminopeptidase n=1 Tax=Carpinus fangiana TaxID=176857 RepID=A0A5N6KSB9_9ROSI|nr:hypothetical protein FH972_022350 [Carpinus fangiana]
MPADRDVLPTSVKPTHYDISLYDISLGAPWNYTGTVIIDLDVKEEVKDITLNSHQLKIHHAQIQASEPIKASNISYNEKSQQATLSFPSSVAPSTKVKLTLTFEGTINNLMAGFYKPAAPASPSTARDDEFHYMFSTQFESSDARRAFPCFDEPNLKASFDVQIEIPEDQTALSNQPEKETKKSKKDGLKVVSFETTPVMSTYLLAWAFGDFEYVEDFTRRKYNGKNLPVRVYTTRGLKEQGRFALEHAHQVIDMFSDIFKIEYPLPKSDLLAVHEFSHGAMENWGLVTYRTTAVLFDEKNSDQKYRNRVAYVVAHELAHQWFGNLVTMDWWSELWLNEGFATWVGWYAIDKLHPDWDIWGQFVQEAMQTAFTLDSVRNSHPIEVPVKDALEVDQIFDHISYLKGASVIRMLAAHLGTETFLNGVAIYLKKHAYGNATTKDLWAGLSEASGQDVGAFIDDWIRQIGFPVLTVAEEPGQISVKQSRFLTTGDVKPEEDSTTWWLPLGLKAAVGKESNAPKALTSKETTIRGIDESFYKLNRDQTGFYRTNYPPKRLEALGSKKDQLSIQDKIGLIGDAQALAVSGDGTTTGLLGLLEKFQDEDNYLVWSQVITSLASVRQVFSTNEKVSKGLKDFTLKLVTRETEKLGWDFDPSESYLTAQLRALLIATAGLAGHEGIIATANKQFDAYFSGDKAALNQNLRSAVWRIAITEKGKPAYDAVKDEFLTTTSVDGREIALTSLGRVQSPELAEDFFKFFMSEHVAVQDVHSGSSSLAANSKTRHQLWELIKADWPHVRERLGGNMVVLDRFLRVSLNKFSDATVQQDIEAFFEGKDNKGYDRCLGVVGDTIGGNATYKARDEAAVLEWLSARGYST